VNQITTLITLLLAASLLFVRRKFLLVPFVVVVCFIPADQRIIIATLDFTPLRILVLVGMLRVLLKGENLAFKLNYFDKLVFAWALCGAIVYVLRWGGINAIIYKSGMLFDLVGLYWLFRTNIHSCEDIKRVVSAFAVCVLLLAGSVAFEWVTHNNPFILLGRVNLVGREGRYRCQASFPHSILLGVFAATLLPLFIHFALAGKRRLLYRLSAFAAIFLTISTWSSTPFLVLPAVACVLLLFRCRHYARQAMWLFLAALFTLHIVMQAPVWHLIGRIRLVGGSGYQRYRIIDAAINHFGEWAALGTKSTAHWGWGLQDVTNQYVLEGVRGGALTLALFVALLAVAFRTLEYHFNQITNKQTQWFVWCVFASLIGHCISFIGVSYFGQIVGLWYFTLAIIGFLTERKEKKTQEFIEHPLLQPVAECSYRLLHGE